LFVSGLFLATHQNKIDKKGRISVPAPFRALLNKGEFQGMVAFPSLTQPAIEGFPMNRMERLSQQIDQLEPFSHDYNDLSASIFADAHPLTFDSEGRIMLPTSLKEHGQFNQDVIFVGRGAAFQIWNPILFRKHQETARARLKEAPPKLGPLPQSEKMQKPEGTRG
jgi:MraZ protein